MKKFLASLLLLSFLVNSVQAQAWISEFDLAVVDDKAYIVETTNGVREIVQYSFPSLSKLKSLAIADNVYGVAYSTGLVLTEYSYSGDDVSKPLVKNKKGKKGKKGASDDAASDDSASGGEGQTAVYTNTYKYTTYDLNLNPVANKTVEYTYDVWYNYVRAKKLTAN
ncbi:MAG: hypothetical protein LW817_02430 [Candidatus Caenarcaniphilales bacterium]|jgi:hypothetical protein|nr:hypothetical protein [Candidatus Caenarcaniphilales bacterium]